MEFQGVPESEVAGGWLFRLWGPIVGWQLGFCVAARSDSMRGFLMALVLLRDDLKVLSPCRSCLRISSWAGGLVGRATVADHFHVRVPLA